MKIGCKSHFFDSGSFSLWTKAAKYAEEHKTGRWAFYDTDEFWQYMEDYVAFIKKYQHAIDFYANVDVIPNAKLSWRNLKWLEGRGLRPVPVVHFRSKIKELQRYLDHGYEYIALGGLVGASGQAECVHWLDECFNLVCDNKKRTPRVRIHGFGVTSFTLLMRYPWWSVDSTSWCKYSAYGNIAVPQRRNGRWVLYTRNSNEFPLQIGISSDSPVRKEQGKHFFNCSPAMQQLVRDWLEEIGVPLGSIDDSGLPLERGVITTYEERNAANVFLYDRICKAMPPYPQPFHIQTRGFGFL